MNQTKYLERFKELTDQMYETTRRKNSDYTGDATQAFKNFTMVETIGFASTEQGFLTRMVDKVMRIAGFIRNGSLKVVDEKITDTLIDLAVYSLLFVIYLEHKQSTGDASKEVKEG